MKKVKSEKTKEKVEDNKFTKNQLISSNIFKNNKDVLSVLVNDDEKLSITEAQERIKKFMKGKVN